MKRGIGISRFTKKISTDIEIFAPAERVWEILMDFAAYPNWNPYIREISGKVEVGKKLKVYMKPEWEKGTTLHPRVIRLVPRKELTWRGSFFFPGLLDGEHSFIIEETGTRRVRFIQKETFSGLAIPFITASWSIEEGTKRSFAEMNSALKKKAEKF